MALAQHEGHRPEPPTQVLDEVLNLDGEAFKDLVDRDIRLKDQVDRGELPGDETTIDPVYSAALRSPAVCERWYQMLVRLKKSTELTIAAKKSDDKLSRIELLAKNNTRKADVERQRYLKWQAGAIRFLTGVEIRLTEANYWRRVHFGSSLPSVIVAERDALSVQVRVLHEAILEHRDDFLKNPDDAPSAADEALWAILND